MEDKAPFSFTTLDIITRQKEETLQKIRKQEKIISNLTKDLFFLPEDTATKGQTIIHMLNISTTFFRGIMFGVKLSKKIKKIFQNMKPQKVAS